MESRNGDIFISLVSPIYKAENIMDKLLKRIKTALSGARTGVRLYWWRIVNGWDVGKDLRELCEPYPG